MAVGAQPDLSDTASGSNTGARRSRVGCSNTCSGSTARSRDVSRSTHRWDEVRDLRTGRCGIRAVQLVGAEPVAASRGSPAIIRAERWTWTGRDPSSLATPSVARSTDRRHRASPGLQRPSRHCRLRPGHARRGCPRRTPASTSAPVAIQWLRPASGQSAREACPLTCPAAPPTGGPALAALGHKAPARPEVGLEEVGERCGYTVSRCSRMCHPLSRRG